MVGRAVQDLSEHAAGLPGGYDADQKGRKEAAMVSQGLAEAFPAFDAGPGVGEGLLETLMRKLGRNQRQRL